MKYIKKLSTKLLLALGVVILSVIIWQVIVSKRVIDDKVKMGQIQSIEQIQELLKAGELKTYNLLSHISFSRIRLIGVDAYILKGSEYAVYISDYSKRIVEIRVDMDELFINSSDGFKDRELPVLIFMPEDPQLVQITQPNDYWPIECKIHGFKGENTLLSFDGQNGTVRIFTDMPYINVNQKECPLNFYTSSLDSTFAIDYCQVNAHVEKGKFFLEDQISDSINVNMRLQESVIEELKINPNAKLGTLSLQGTLFDKKDEYDYRNVDKMKIKYPAQCDSLIIRLTSNPGHPVQLFLSKDLSGKFEDIDCSDNVIIERSDE